MQRFLIFIWIIVIVTSCARSVSPGKESGYSEDISLYRPVYPDPLPDSVTSSYYSDSSKDPKFTPPDSSITKGLDSLIDSIATYTRSRGYYTLYTIQVYTGTDSNAANEAKSLVYENFEELLPKLEYKQPIFKVKVGMFYERFDAQKELLELKKIFPRAILIPERIYPDK